MANLDNNNLKSNDSHELGQMPIGKLLFKVSVPMMISMFMLACYNVVDSIFISRVSESALSALSLAYPVQFLMVALNIGTNIGMTALISRSLGAKKVEHANEYARHGLFISVIYFIFFAILGSLFTNKFFCIMTKDSEIIDAGTQYLSIITIFSFGFFIQTTFEKMMQGTGKTIGSMISQLSGAIINIFLDPILIFGYFGFPAMGTRGAAIATVLGQIIGMFIGIILNRVLNKDITLDILKFKFKPQMIMDIYKIGVPSIIMQSIGSLMVLGLNSILIKYQSAVAILGIYYKLQSFIFMPLIGLNNGMVPIVSYNFGAHKKDRINEVIKLARISGLIIMLIGSSILILIPDKVLHLFAANEVMLKTGIYAFRIIALHFPLVSANIILSSVMQATKKEVYSLFASLIRQIVILLPTAYILSNTFGIKGVWFCFLISEFVAFIIIRLLYKKAYNEQIANL